ncbi:hypothetical protein [Streptomyces sp. NPDC059783]|uniref:hypothetical protein n=1 Tax=Streptomyces sp. NPDC059783 TaxID=3346944 RepID=UPI00364EA2C4
MRISRLRSVATGLFLGAALLLTACGQEHAAGTPVSDAGPSRGGLSPAPSGPARGNVEPDAHGGAPHYRENNGFKIPKEMTPASAKAARAEAARIEPVLKRLWKARKWDAESVRAELLKLGYREKGSDSGEAGNGGGSGEGSGRLDVRANGSSSNPGAGVALYVGRDACVTAFVQSTNYQVSVNGRFIESGCFEPRGGH